MSDLLTLAERCEKSDAPDRTIDADIWFVVTPGATRKDLVVKSDKGLWPDYTIDETRDGTGRLIIVPAYTGSLDAARTLVPEAHAASVEWSPRFPGYAWLFPPDNKADIQFEGEASSPALALCAAALRARGAVSGSGERGK